MMLTLGRKPEEGIMQANAPSIECSSVCFRLRENGGKRCEVWLLRDGVVEQLQRGACSVGRGTVVGAE
jgi:hypothetical protein